MAAPKVAFEWTTIVNNGDYMPTDACDPEFPTVPTCRTFNSYNQPSVNARGLVVMRARSRGGQGQQQNVHGVYIRDMTTKGPVQRILDRDTRVPQPNNLDSEFVEPPSFPRIDIKLNTIATRGNHQPVWEYTLADGSETRVGASGIYTNPFGDLITGASKLGAVPEFSFYEVPEVPGTPFDVFPGAPAVANGTTLVFKGNYTVEGIAKTGVYYRRLSGASGGGTAPVVLIANNTDTFIPGTNQVFGSTAPPSAVGNKAIFAGFDNEENPMAGGIYMASLTPYKRNKQPMLESLVTIGSQVPGEPRNTTFNRLGEGVSFDGRFVAFWGAWGEATKTVRLYCPDEGNQDRRAFCKSENSGSTYDPDIDNWYQERQVPVNQGIFVHDTRRKTTFKVARTGENDFTDFEYWNFSGKAPGVGEGEEDGELARWRSASFVAVSGKGANYHVAFKARKGDTDENHVYVDPVDGIYLNEGPAQAQLLSLITTGMDGTAVDPEAVDPDTGDVLPVTEMGIERDGFRGDLIVINAKMGTEEEGWAGIYLTTVP
ncbi:MAG: hypothetical protein ACPW60_08945 [Methylohalobius sp. ZOD2]